MERWCAVLEEMDLPVRHIARVIMITPRTEATYACFAVPVAEGTFQDPASVHWRLASRFRCRRAWKRARSETH
jgi:hypothetical protein